MNILKIVAIAKATAPIEGHVTIIENLVTLKLQNKEVRIDTPPKSWTGFQESSIQMRKDGYTQKQLPTLISDAWEWLIPE